MLRMFSKAAFFLCLGLLAAGCSARQEALQKSVENFAKALRRGDPEMAASYVQFDKRPVFSKAIERLDRDLMVSHVEVRNVTPDDKMETASMTLWMEYFDQASSSVSTSRASFLWKYDSKAEAWWLDATSPFGK